MKPKHPNFSKFLTLSFGLAIAGISIQPVQATPLSWDGLTAGTWGLATNWNPDQTPTTADTLTIAGPGGVAGSTLSIDVFANAAAGTIDFTNTSSTSLVNTSGAAKSLTLQSIGGVGLTTGSGAVTIGSTTGTQNVTVALGSSQTWTIGAGGLTTNGLTGAFTVTKTGAGTWAMQGSSSTISGVTIDNGLITFNNANSVGAAGATATLGTATNPANNVEFRASAATSNFAANIVVASGAGTRTFSYVSSGTGDLTTLNTATILLNKELIISRSGGTGVGAVQINGVISGAGGIATDGSGSNATIALNNANTYTGDTRVSAGRLNLKNQLAAQSSTINLTTTTANGLLFDQGVVANAFTIGGLASTTSGAGKDVALVNSSIVTTTGVVTLNPTAIALTLGNSTTDASYAGVLSGAGSIIKTGSNTQTFSGTNTYTGGTALNGGTLVYNNAAALGTSGNITFGGGTLKYSGFSTDLSARIATGSSTGAIKIDVNGQSVSYATALTGSQSGGLVLSDSGSGGILRLTQANAYTGGTILNSGELDLDNNGGLGSGALTINGGTLVSRTTSRNLSNAVTVGGDFALNKSGNGLNFTLSGTIDLGAAVRTVTVSAGNGTSIATFSNTVSNSNGGLTKAGLGTLLLTGANTYTGATSVTAGTLSVSGSGKLGSVNNSLAISSNAIVDLNGTSQGVGVLSGAGTIDNVTTGTTNTLTVGNNNATGGDFSGAIKNTTGTLSVTKTGTGTQTFSGTNTYTGATSVSAGVLALSNASGLGTGGAVSVASNARLELSGGINISGHTITISGTGSGANTNGALRSASGSNTWTGSVVLGDTNSRIGSETGATLTIDGVISSGTIGNGLVVKSGAASGTVILKGANTYSGTTNLVLGTLQIAGGDDRLATDQTLTIGNNGLGVATFDLNGLNQKVAGLASNSGNNSGIVDNVSAGGNSTLTIDGTSSNTFAGVIKNTSGTVSLIKTGSGTQTLSGTNTYTGATAVQLGKLVVSGFIGNSAVTVTGTNTTLASGSTGTIGNSLIVNSGAILAAGDVNSVGAATVGSGGIDLKSGSIFEWDLTTNSSASGFDTVATSNNGNLAVASGAIFRVVLGGAVDGSDSFWTSGTRSWNVFSVNGTGTTTEAISGQLFDTFQVVDATTGSLFTGVTGSFTFTGSTLTWSAVPEPTSALAGVLIGAGLLRRRRNVQRPTASIG